MKRFIAIFAALVLSLLSLQAQAAEKWWTYVASYDGLPGEIRVDLALRASAPMAAYPQLMVTGSSYVSAHPTGLPEPRDDLRIAALTAKIVATVHKATPAIYLGSFTHKNEQMHYFYVKDAAKAEKALVPVYAHICDGCRGSTIIKDDPSWSAYTDFMYPNAKTREFYKVELGKLGVPIK